MGGKSILWGLECVERGPSPRPGHAVMDDSGKEAEVIGYITSGGPSPSKGMSGIALGYLENCEEGRKVWVQINPRRRILATVVRPPFLKL